jgi:hypothetical protein
MQGDSGSATTDANGEATFTYMGDGGEGNLISIKASFITSRHYCRVSSCDQRMD